MMSMNDHELAEITGTWDYSTLPSNVRIGPGCYIERKQSLSRFRSRRDPGLVLGSGVSIYTWCEFSIEEMGLVEIGDDCILAGAIFMCAEHIRLGARVVVSYNVTIADCDFHPREPDLRRQDAIASAPFGDKSRRPPLVAQPVVIEDDVWVGIGAIILKGVRIGAGARIDAGAVVTRDLPAGSHVHGNPARPR
jgi:acetyltransferase-like isoleucine patch superfamily enzyme